LRKNKKTEDIKKKKEDFIKKYLPNCMNSPGGTQKLLPATNINSAKRGDVGKMKKVISRNNLIHSAKIPKSKSKLSRTGTQGTSSHGLYIIDGQSELSTLSHQPITSQDGARERRGVGVY
jgi:hypothetical protein